MRTTLRSDAVLQLLVIALLASGCASPIGIRIASPRDVQTYLTRNALTDDEPSDFSQNELRRYDLIEKFKHEPDATLEQLRTEALANGLPSNTLFALAELSFLRAEDDEKRASYAAALVYAFAFLFPGDGRPPLDPLDPRERIAADIYNRALTSAFARTREGTLALDGSGLVDLPFGRITVRTASNVLEMNGYELYDLQPVAELQIWGLRNRYRRPGIGAPLAAQARPLPGVVPVVPVPATVRVPLTAVLVIDAPLEAIRGGELRAQFELLPNLDFDDVEIDGRGIPLEAEPTAALAAGLMASRFWTAELETFLGNAFGVRASSGLGAIRPYKHGRIPVVFVHGTASSPARWADMINDLLADPRLRDRYAFWLFKYDSGNPIGYSAYHLREALKQAVARADPSGSDPCARDMVVMGHSQGGLLTKFTVIDTGNALWANVSSKPFDELAMKPAEKALLHDVLFVKPLPFVTEVIFLATPQRGSYLAGPQLVRRLAAYLVRLPSNVASIGADLVTLLPAGGSDVMMSRIPTSIDNMSPGNPMIKTLAQIPVSPNVVAHSIISVENDSPLDVAGDGVVKYESAHIEPVASELIVRSPHSGMQAAPATVEEVRRILLEHSGRSACPVPVNAAR